MRLPTQLHEDWLGQALARLSSVIDMHSLVQMYQRSAVGHSSSVLLKTLWHENNGVAFSLVRALDAAKRGERWFPQDRDDMRATSVALTVDSVLQSLERDAARRFLLRFESALEQPHLMRGLAFEARIAAHLAARGCELDLVPEGAKRAPDWVAHAGDYSFEVECKSVSNDKGRQIHRDPMIRFWDQIVTEMAKLIPGMTRGLAVMITIPGRLPKKVEEHQELVRHVLGVILGKPQTEGRGPAHVELAEFAAARFPTAPSGGEPDHAQVRAFCAQLLGRAWESREVIAVRMGGAPLVLCMRSEVKDVFVEGLFGVAADGSKQLRGDRPGLVCLNLEDVTAAELRELALAPLHSTALAHWSESLFLRRKGTALAALAFFADGDVVRNGGLATLDGTSYYFASKLSRFDPEAMLDRVFRTRP